MIWHIRLLGGVRAEGLGGTISRWSTQQAAGLLAWLAWHDGRSFPREEVLELLWPGEDPTLTRNRLSVTLSALRRQLEPPGIEPGAVLRTDRFVVGLTPGACTTDVGLLRQAAAAVRRGGDPEALDRALALWSGPLLAGLYLDWAPAAQEDLNDLYLDLLRRQVERQLAAGDGAGALATGRQATAVDPLREEGHALLIRAALALGDSALAQRQVRAVRELFARELGSAPSPELLALAHEAPGPRAAAPEPAPVLTGTTTLLACVGEPRGDWDELVQAHRGRSLAAAGARVAAFPAAGDALGCAADLGGELRLALLTSDGGSARSAVAAVAALVAGAHVGQCLCEESCAALLDADVRALGRFCLGPGAPGRQVCQVTLPGTRERGFPPPALAPERVGSVPAQLSRFFDRDVDRAAVRELLATPDVRLVTVTGIGGTGKTRLALELARELLGTGPAAVWFVALASVRAAATMVDRILDTLGVERTPGAVGLDRLIWALRRRPTLLVLDNFEQLPQEAAEVVSALLARAPELRVLVTSRQRLGVPGEREYPLAPLPVPSGAEELAALAASPSVSLFVDRAQAARPAFGVTKANAGALAALCERLEGLPLAIELAAPRVGTMTPQTMLARLGERLDWRAARFAGLPERQQTLRATLAWSRDLLPGPLRAFLDQLAVFRGTFSAAAAQAVTGGGDHTGDWLTQLRGWSLLGSHDWDEEVRFGLLLTVREYLQQTADPELLAQARQRHAQHYLGRVSELTPEAGPVALVGQARVLEADLDNLRAALDWALEHQPEQALAATVGLNGLWELRGREREGYGWVNRAYAATPDAPQELRLAAALARGRLANAVATRTEACEVLEEALGLARAAGDVGARLQALFLLGVAGSARGDAEPDVTAYAQEAAEIEAAVGGPSARFVALALRVIQCQLAGQRVEALGPLEEAMALAKLSGDPVQVLATGTHLAASRFNAYDPTGALAVIDDLPGLPEELGGYFPLRALLLEGWVAGVAGDLERSAAAFCRSAPRAAGLVFSGWLACSFAMAAAAAGRQVLVAQCLGAHAASCTDAKITHRSGMGGEALVQAEAAARAALGDAGYAAAWAEGARLTSDQIAELLANARSLLLG